MDEEDVIANALRAELGARADTALGVAALDIADRLDSRPGHDTAVRLFRELRQMLLALAKTAEPTSDVEDFLERIASSDFGHPGH